ncbi:GOLPH3/VPS74 family protein [Actinomadura rubrisoli]|nr:GPP34 family phosphoprotein [Actinomadura rubrisoli]
MRIADELLLLAIHPTGGRPVIGDAELDLGLAGAILADLVLSGRVELTAGGVRPAAVTRPPAGDPELDGAFAQIVRAPGARAARVITALSGETLRLRLRNGLIGRGVLAEEEQWVLGVLTSSSHPELNPAPRREILARLDAALGGAVSDERTATLLAIAHACDLARELFPKVPGLEKHIPVGWAAPAVAAAVAEMRAAAPAATPARATPRS